MRAIFSLVLLTGLPILAQQATLQINTEVLRIGMTKQDVFHRFPVIVSDEKRLSSADEIPNDEVLIVCTTSEPGTCNGGEVQFHKGLLNYADKSWYTNDSAASTIAELLGAISRTVPNRKTTPCTVRYSEEHESDGMHERTFITCGNKGVYIGRFPLPVSGISQREGQDISEFIGVMTSERH